MSDPGGNARPLSDILDYHAHVYYGDDTSKGAAEKLRAGIVAEGFDVALGRWHDDPVGPHPVGSYQIAFAASDFATLVPWLALNHGQNAVLIHPNTDDPIADHSDHALWLGKQLELDIPLLKRLLAKFQASEKDSTS